MAPSDASPLDRLPPSSKRVCTRLLARARALGLDVSAPLNARWYDARVAPEFRLPEVPGGDLAVVLGSGRPFWAAFRRHLRDHPEAVRGEDPQDAFVEKLVSWVVQPIHVPVAVRHAHDEPPRRVSMIRAAESAGLVAESVASRLAVHPVRGPWLALRAIVRLGLPGPTGDPPRPPRTCGPCPGVCRDRFDRAMAAARETSPHRAVAAHWQDWLAVRDACRLGRQYRYTGDQIRYNYTRDRQTLGFEKAP